jgi:hypothetical protein
MLDSTQSEEERDFIPKEDVNPKSQLLVKLTNLLRVETISVLMGSGLFRTVFSFRAATLGLQIFVGHHGILYPHRSPDEVFLGGESKAGIKAACLVHARDLLFGIQPHVWFHRFDKGKVRLPQIKEIEAIPVLLKQKVREPRDLAMH